MKPGHGSGGSIVLITNKLPYPRVDGRKNILMQYLEHLKILYPNHKIINLSFIDEEKYVNEKPDTIDETIRLDPPGKWEKMKNLIVKSFLTRKWPLQVSLFFSRKTGERIKEIIGREKPEMVLYDTVRVGEYCVNLDGTTSIMNYDDLLSLRYKRQLNYLKYSPSILGFLGSKMPRALSQIINSTLMKRLILNYEIKLLEKYEEKIAGRFDSLVFTSSVEAREFKGKINHPNCVGIPMNCDSDHPVLNRDYDRNKIIFIGRMDIPHNIAAAMYFCEQIWGRIKEINPLCKFYIIGKSPAPNVLELASRYQDVYVTGEVKEVYGISKDASVFVAPLLFGSGIKTKVIEAMTWGIPVVSTGVGAEGITYENQVLRLTEDPAQFASYVVELTRNQVLNEELSRRGQQFVQNHFSSKSNLRNWKELLVQTTGGVNLADQACVLSKSNG